MMKKTPSKPYRRTWVNICYMKEEQLRNIKKAKEGLVKKAKGIFKVLRGVV